MVSKPDNNVGFTKIATIQQLVGCYENLGQGGKDGPKRYLTHILWPGVDTEHEKIKSVRVQMLSDSSLRVTGESSGSVLQEGIFIEGKDFSLSSGKITITNDLLVSLATEAGNPFIGAAHGSVTLGLDERGDGKLKETGTFAGTAFIIIPLVGHVSDSIRFSKNPAACEKR